MNQIVDLMLEHALSLICLSLGLIIVITCLFYLYREISSKKWPATEGVILSSMVSMRGRSYGADVRFKYTVNNKSFIKNTYSIVPRGYFWMEGASQITLKYPTDKKVQVYYHPTKPDWAVLEPGLRSMTSIVFLLCGVFIMALGYIFQQKGVS